MRLQHFLNEKVSKKDYAEALNNPNVMVGAEYEFYIDEDIIEKLIVDDQGEGVDLDDLDDFVDIDDDYKLDLAYAFLKERLKTLGMKSFKKLEDYDSSTNWTFQTDNSLSSNRGLGVEITSPPVPINQFLDEMKKMFNFISSIGFTDGEAGLHIGVSFKDRYMWDDIDPLKLAVFMDEGYIWKYFPERVDNEYAEKVIGAIEDKLHNVNIDLLKTISPGKHKNQINDDDALKFSKYYGINFSKIIEGDNYIEFRYLGGTNYEKKYKRIQDTLVMYVHALKLAFDPEYKKKEYIKKLLRAINRNTDWIWTTNDVKKGKKGKKYK